MRTRKEIESELERNKEDNFYEEVAENQYILIEVLLDIREIIQVQLTGRKE